MIAYSLSGLTITHIDSGTLTGTYSFSMEASRGSLCAELQAMITDSSAVNNNYAYDGCIYRIRSGTSKYLGDSMVYSLEFRKKSNDKFPMDVSADFLSQIILATDNEATVAERVRNRKLAYSQRLHGDAQKAKGIRSSELWRQNEIATTEATSLIIKNRPSKERQRRVLSSKKMIGTVSQAKTKKTKRSKQLQRSGQPASILVETRVIKNDHLKRNIVFTDGVPQSNNHSMSPRKKIKPPIHTNLIKGLDNIKF